MDLHDITFEFEESSLINKNNQTSLHLFAHSDELLFSHLAKTRYVFENLVEESVLRNFYNEFSKREYINLQYVEFKSIISDAILFHDIGKISFSFQNKLNKSNSYELRLQEKFIEQNNLNELKKNFVDTHSLSGAFCFILKYEDKFNENILFFLILFYSIFSHHTDLKDLKDLEWFDKVFSLNQNKTIQFLSLFLKHIPLTKLNEYNRLKFRSFLKKAYSFNLNQDNSLSFFYSYFYSLLIVSDIFASKEYDNPIDIVKTYEIKKFNNRIDALLKQKLSDSFYNVEYNINLKNLSPVQNIDNIEDLNMLRRNMLLESSFNLKEAIKFGNSNVFFLNMPTGGGKTNTSMKLALDLIENTSANRIIYAMPFINIIEQNYDIIKDHFNLNEEQGEIRKIYSATETLFMEKSDEFKSKIILQDSFFNYPVIFTTFSTFFDGILRTSKRHKYKVSSFVNSVVILDEIQSLPLKNWNSLYYLINEMSESYNIYFIIMSATLPKFDKLKLDKSNNLVHKEPVQLIKNPERYFDHFLFDRTKIKNRVHELSIDNSLEIKEYLLDDIIRHNFKNGYTKGLIVLNTIKSSKIIYDILKEYANGEFDVDLLNSSLLYNVKKEIISKINNMKYDSERYVLVSTQSIEAGVDVSFDFVVRDFAIIDSIEQIRGRCNRSRELNVNDPYRKGNIYLINLKDKKSHLHEYIYNEQELNSRILETHKLFNEIIDYSYENILNYYESVSEDINKLEDAKESNYFLNDRKNIQCWNNMYYSKLQDKTDGIHIIDNQLSQYSLFIPVKLHIFTEFFDEKLNLEMNFEYFKEIYEYNKDKFVFSYKELKFLKLKQKNSNYKFIDGNIIDGCELIKFYMDYIASFKHKDFSSLNIISKEFSSILNKFIINITINNDELEYKILDETDGDFKKYEYFYIMNKELIGDDEFSVYSISNGLNYSPYLVEIYD